MTFALDASDTQAGLIHLEVLVDGEPVWPHPDREDPGSDFEPEDVVAWLADSWPPLLLEQSWPIQFQPDQEPRSITGLLRAAEHRWENFSAADAEEVGGESARIDAFLYAHDLRQMKHGAGLNAFFVLRQHTNVRIETNGNVYEDVDFRSFIAQLTELGTLAVTLLRKRAGGIAARLIERWGMREQIAPLDAAALVSGLPRPEIEASPDLSRAFAEALGNRQLSEIANDNNAPIPAAARASGVLGPAGLVEILRRINALPDGNITRIGKLRRRLQRDLRDIKHSPDQGIRAANLVREWLKVAGDQEVDLLDLSRRLDIQVERQAIPDNRLDGIATTRCCLPCMGT
jgi:hypothetical protein